MNEASFVQPCEIGIHKSCTGIGIIGSREILLDNESLLRQNPRNTFVALATVLGKVKAGSSFRDDGSNEVTDINCFQGK